ncbi:glutamate receptor ionotropic, kainate 2 isoform X2 [Procambarus clarkii]|uniref:glutamate receptor ionotropic, kainate 2 isoform X2 n=1 Tax=Procambarus clarkii TaxID=6728 RepID=UPI003741EAB2
MHLVEHETSTSNTCRRYDLKVTGVALGAGVGAESAMAAGWRTALGVATGSALHSLPEAFRKTVAHVHLCLSEDLDEVFVRGVWKGGRTPTSVWTPLECQVTALGHSAYHSDGATYVLVGRVRCLLHYLSLIRRLAAKNTINITKTLYLLVPTEAVNTDVRALVVSSIPEKLNVVLLSLQHSLEETLGPRRESREGKNSVRELMFASRRADSTERMPTQFRRHDGKSELDHSQRLKRQNTASERASTNFGAQQTETTFQRSSKTRPETNKGDSISSSARLQVTLHVAESPGDGSVFFRKVGIWSWSSGLVLDGGLKATPSVNFYGRNLVMTIVYEADVSPMDFSPSLERALVVDFSEWFSRDNVIIVSQAPRPLQRPFLLLHIFSGWVWVTILIMGVSSGSFLWVLDLVLGTVRAGRKLHRRDAPVTEVHVSYLATVATILKLFVLQGSRTWSVSLSALVAASCVFLAVVSLVGVYQGFIVAFLAVPKRGPPIDSAMDLIQRLDTVIPIVRKNTVYYQFVVKFESYRPIAAKLTFHQDEFINTWGFFQLVHRGKYALIDTYSSGVGRAAMFESRAEECRFHVSRQVLQPDLDLMAYRQNSVFRERIDLALRQLRSFGIIDKIKADFYSTSCETQLSKGNLQALNLIQMQSAFYVLVVGHLVALMGFIVEITCNSCRCQRVLKASLQLQ